MFMHVSIFISVMYYVNMILCNNKSWMWSSFESFIQIANRLLFSNTIVNIVKI